MKKLIFSFTVVILLMTCATAQTARDSYILLGAHVPEQIEGIPAIAKRMLINKLGQIITENGITDDVNNSRFIITPNVTILSKNVLGTAPPRYSMSLELSLYIGDGVAGNLFASESFSLKGVGLNENKAYIMALKQLKPKSPQIKAFVEKGKLKIIDYYNNNCNVILTKAEQAARVNNYREAVALLGNIPAESTCLEKTQRPLSKYFASFIDFECRENLNQARNIWSANQNLDAANEAAALLSEINPNASCFSDVQRLFNDVSKRAKELSDRPWEFQLQKLDVQRSQINAARDVAIEQARNQPNSLSYNIGRWF